MRTPEVATRRRRGCIRCACANRNTILRCWYGAYTCGGSSPGNTTTCLSVRLSSGNASAWNRSTIAGTPFTSPSFPWDVSTVEPEPCIDCRRQASTKLMQGKGNHPLPLHPIPKTRTKICQLCPRSKLSTVSPGWTRVSPEEAPKGRKK